MTVVALHRCESCAERAELMLPDGSWWCRPCDTAAVRLGYDEEAVDANLRRTRIRRVSTKRAKKLRDRQPLRDALQRRSGGRCEVRFSPYCTGVGQAPHHILKASQGGSDTLENCLWSCNICNSSIEDEPLRAHSMGLVRKSWEPAP